MSTQKEEEPDLEAMDTGLELEDREFQIQKNKELQALQSLGIDTTQSVPNMSEYNDPFRPLVRDRKPEEKIIARNAYASGNHTKQEIADAAGVHRITIGNWVKDNNWKGSFKVDRHKLTPEVYETAERMYETGNHPVQEIADAVGVSRQTIRNWVKDNNWEGSYRSSPRASPRTIRLTPELSGGKRKTKKNTKQSRKRSHRKRITKKSKQTRRK